LTPEPIPLKEATDEFLEAKSHLRSRTHDIYKGILRCFRESLPPGAMLQDVEPSDIRAYVMAKKISNATQRKRYRHLQVFFNWAKDEDRIQENPLHELEPPKKETKEKAFLRPEDVKKLLSKIKEHILETRDAAGRIPDLEWLHRMIPVAVCTGLWRGELVALQWEDVDLAGRKPARPAPGRLPNEGQRRAAHSRSRRCRARAGPDARAEHFRPRVH
jgi:integrase